MGSDQQHGQDTGTFVTRQDKKSTPDKSSETSADKPAETKAASIKTADSKAAATKAVDASKGKAAEAKQAGTEQVKAKATAEKPKTASAKPETSQATPETPQAKPETTPAKPVESKAKSEPAKPHPVAAPPPETRPSSSLWPAAAIAVVGSVAAGTISSWGPSTIGYPTALEADTSQFIALEERIVTLSEQIEELGGTVVGDLEARLAVVEAAPQPDETVWTNLESGLGAVQERLEAVESRPNVDPAAVEAVESQVGGLAEDMAELDVSEAMSSLTERLGGLEGGVANIEGRISALQSAMTAVETTTNQNATALAEQDTGLRDNASLILAVDSARSAVEQSRGFADLMPNLEALAAGDADLAPAISELQAEAETGVASAEALKASFPATARAIRLKLRAGEEASLISQTLSNITGLVDVRPTGEAAEEASDNAQANAGLASLISAEDKLANDDLAGAVDALATLDGGAGDVAASWIGKAENYLRVDGALNQLRQAALTRLGQGAS